MTVLLGTNVPAWADDLRKRYLKGEVFQFILHGNIDDLVLHNNTIMHITEYLADILLSPTKETILFYNNSTGVRVAKKHRDAAISDELLLYRNREKVMPQLEQLLLIEKRCALILEYAEMLAPASDIAMYGDTDRATLVTLHRWASLAMIERADNIIILMTENLTELHPRIANNPRIAAIHLPMPDHDARLSFITHVAPQLDQKTQQKLAEITAGLRMVQIRNILMPQDAPDDIAKRRAVITALLGTQATPEKVEALARMTKGVSDEEMQQIISSAAIVPAAPAQPQQNNEIEKIVMKQKRDVIERECAGLLQFVEPKHGFEAVGGMSEVKRELKRVAENIRNGETQFVPMGFLFVGPMGTGKTFVAEAFAKESGLTAIKFGSFRSKWVGATESNLEKILDVIEAMGQVIVIIDEVERALGGNDASSDGGTESRVIARLKEFMSNTRHRGKILFILMTNRPDLLDTDIKRTGRIDRKIPFFYPQTALEVEPVLQALIKRHNLSCDIDIAAHRDLLCEPLKGYSNADIEGVLMLAASLADSDGRRGSVALADLAKAAADYLPARDKVMLEYMELLAVFEASNRSMLPEKYAVLSGDELSAKLHQSRLQAGHRR